MFDGITLLFPYLLVVVIAAIGLQRLFKGKRKSPLPHPPGPRPLPLLGNALDFPIDHLGREFRELTNKYGDVVYLKVLGQSVILVGSYDVSCELLEKRSANYSDRPQSAMVNMTNLDWIFVFKNYGPEWRKYRRELHNSFVPERMAVYHPMQREVTCQLLRNMLDAPADFSRHIKFSFAAVILRVVYGLEADHGENKYYRLVERLATIAEDISTPGRHLVEAFPSMQRLPSWFPGTGFQKLAAEWKQELVAIRDYLYDSAKDAMRANGVKESVITRLSEESTEEDLARNVTATMYAAGGDTTTSTVHAFVLAMAMHPGIQCKAQAELDAIVGRDRFPDFSDQIHLPYVNALLKEILRWHVVAPIGVPHRSVEDDVYNGYHIPAGSIIIANQWAMSRDPEHYPNAEQFDPERFLIDGKLNPNVRDPADFVFGFGRRICPGKAFGEGSLFITCASILHAFSIRPPLDENGVPKRLELRINKLAVSHPLPFECRIAPRNAQMEALVRLGAA